ncbi:MAG: hypothetical protein FWC89_08330, partial [Defluviitaleaceae bacterium]|nr:hypothetical protein [Defluviitaleaceae bacterium]
KKGFMWFITSAAGISMVQLLAKVAFLGLFLLALGAAGALPRSPFAVAIHPLMDLMSSVPYVRYIHAFVPVAPILLVMHHWILAVVGFHIINVYLRLGKVIKS